MKIRMIAVAAALMMLSGCASAPVTGDANVYRPTLADNPKNYLGAFSLGVISKEAIVEHVGTPDKTTTVGSQELLTYTIQRSEDGVGRIEYTYVIENGKVIEVRYLNSGNFFGVQQMESAKQLQGK